MRRSDHVQYDIEYHIVWTTKYRYKILSGKIAERCREIIRQSCRAMEINVIRGSIGKDHVHLMLSCPPNISVSKIIQQLKGKTSRIMMSEYKDLRKRYWGQHMWAVGYFCRSVGDVSKEMIKKYIENQEDEYEVTFPMMSGKVKIKKVTVNLDLASCNDKITATTTAESSAGNIENYEYQIDNGNWIMGSEKQEFTAQSAGQHTIKVKVTDNNNKTTETSKTINLPSVEIYGKQIPTATCLSGLYEVKHENITEIEDGWKQTEYRYAGAYANNYVYFNCKDDTNEQNNDNCEKWRIIGLVNVKTSTGEIEQRLKIIRDESIGIYAWDHQSVIYENDWTQASLMGMLNDTYYNSEDNSTYCRTNSSSPSTTACKFKTGDTKGLTEKARDMIEKDTLSWNLGGSDSVMTTADEMYTCERSGKTATAPSKSNPTEWNTETTKDPKNDEPKPNLFRGVGLIYASDYGYTVGGGPRNACFKITLNNYNTNNCSINSYLYEGTEKFWTLTHDSSYNETHADEVFIVGNVLAGQYSYSDHKIYPSVYIQEKVRLGEGNGTSDSPYHLEA